MDRLLVQTVPTDGISLFLSLSTLLENERQYYRLMQNAVQYQ
jgi:hypothetical protein